MAELNLRHVLRKTKKAMAGVRTNFIHEQQPVDTLRLAFQQIILLHGRPGLQRDKVATRFLFIRIIVNKICKSGQCKSITMPMGLDDGPDYSPDGRYIYFNSQRTGAMRIWRMNSDRTNQTQVTNDAQYRDWFPHPSPDGKWIVFLSYDCRVKGHPANKEVVLRIMPAPEGKPKILLKLFGSHGTINVPSWSPDSHRIAFVSYRPIEKNK